MIFQNFIEILPFLSEKRIPLIKLSKSKDGQTGSATLLFIKPKCFQDLLISDSQIHSIKLVSKSFQLKSNKISIFFKNGKPFVLKTLFIFTKKEEYFFFFDFIALYAKENKLFYFKKM